MGDQSANETYEEAGGRELTSGSILLFAIQMMLPFLSSRPNANELPSMRSSGSRYRDLADTPIVSRSTWDKIGEVS